MFSLKYVRLLGDLKQYSEADRVLEQLFFNHPGHLEGHRLLGDLLFERGKFKAALEEFKRTLLISEAYLPGYHGMAKVFAKLGDPEGEYEVLLKIHGQEPNRPEVLLRLGILERALKKPASLERFRRVLEIAPESVQGSEARYFIRHTAAR
jgi:tetratricopeptide (TPR) repeat protein